MASATSKEDKEIWVLCRWTEKLAAGYDGQVDVRTFSDGILLPQLVEDVSGQNIYCTPKPMEERQKEENLEKAIDKIRSMKIVEAEINVKDILSGSTIKAWPVLKSIFYHWLSNTILEVYKPKEKENAPVQLLQWINEVLNKDLVVYNFASDWFCGRALGALIDHLKSGLCPKWNSFEPRCKLKNIKELMQLAEDTLGIQQLIKPCDMYTEGHELYVIVYLSQFLSQGTPERGHSINQPEPCELYDILPEADLPEDLPYSEVDYPCMEPTYNSRRYRSKPPLLTVADEDYPSVDPWPPNKPQALNIYPDINDQYQYDKRHRELLPERKVEQDTCMWAYLDSRGVEYNEELKQEVKQCSLDLGRKLGSGCFGSVYEARFYDASKEYKYFAVKTLAKESGVKDLQNFLNEALVMRGFQHKNVQQMQGLAFKDKLLCILLPLMENKDLHTYLIKHETFKVNELFTYALGIAEGMRYITLNKFVHRDLAARNCLIDADKTIKVGDFGFSRDVFIDNYTTKNAQVRLPIKWMAPELLETNSRAYKACTDVWAYGIVLGEIYSLGGNPYPNLQDAGQLKHMLEQGKRWDKRYFVSVTVEMYDVMEKCWSICDIARPSFDEIVNCLKKMPQTDVKKTVTRQPIHYNEIYPTTDRQLPKPPSTKTLPARLKVGGLGLINPVTLSTSGKPKQSDSPYSIGDYEDIGFVAPDKEKTHL